MYDYPLDPNWTTQEIIDVIALYNAVEQAYEGGISKAEFMEKYRVFCQIVDSKGEQKRIDKAFFEVSNYSIYKVSQLAKENDWIEIQ
jgi:uncharacterized protein YktA (UPF0223 family)